LRQIAPRIDDGDHWLVEEILTRVAHLQSARAMAEGAQVSGAECALASKFAQGLARHVLCSWSEMLHGRVGLRCGPSRLSAADHHSAGSRAGAVSSTPAGRSPKNARMADARAHAARK